MSILDITRRRLLQAGGLIVVSNMLPSISFAAEKIPNKNAAIPLNYVDSFIALTADGSMTAFNGHVNLGTRIRTSLAQIVADEIGYCWDENRNLCRHYLPSCV